MQAANVLKESMPEVPIVWLTMYNVGRWANDLGIDAVVSKPDGIGRLAECVRSLLATSRQFVVKYRTAIFDLQPDVMSWL